MGFAADSHRIVFLANEPGHKVRDYLFDVTSSKLQPLTSEGVRGFLSPDGKFLAVRNSESSAAILAVETGSPVREIKGLQEPDRLIQMTADGADAFVANYNGLTATVYRVHLNTGDRQLIKTLEMRDPTGGYGVTRVLTTPDGQYFAYNTLRQLSELYLLQGLR